MRQRILHPDSHEPNEHNDFVLKKLDGMENLTQMEIGGVNFFINGPVKTPHLVQEHDPIYREFFAAENKTKNTIPGTIDIKINLKVGNLPDTGKFTKIFDSNQSWLMFREDDIYWAVLHPPAHEKPIWAARFNRDVKEVTVYCREQYIQKRNGKTIILNPVRYPLDQLLIMYILAPRQGAVIHAAGIEINGNGFIFPGPSGAGKSTLCRQFILANPSNSMVFSDDRMVVRKSPGDHGAFRVFGTPWPGELGIARSQDMPLHAIFFLRHGTGNKIKQLEPRQALDNLLKVTSIPWYDRDVMPEVLRFCEDLITHAPLFELHFTPGLEAVRFLETHTRGISIKKTGYRNSNFNEVEVEVKVEEKKSA
jgi:hypothetical protein